MPPLNKQDFNLKCEFVKQQKLKLNPRREPYFCQRVLSPEVYCSGNPEFTIPPRGSLSGAEQHGSAGLAGAKQNPANQEKPKRLFVYASGGWRQSRRRIYLRYGSYLLPYPFR